MSDLNDQAQVRAKKRHICQLCGRAIKPGDEYIRQRWFDAGFHTAARHIHCDALLDEFLNDNSFTNEYTDDEVWEWIRERCLELCGGDIREECENDPYSCGCMIESITNINSRRAAEQSVRDNDEELDANG